MEDNKNEIVLQRVKDTIDTLNGKKSNIYFFVSDSKNIPNSSTLYIYNMAVEVKKLGYNVTMLYQLSNEYTKHEIDRLKRLEKPIDELRTFEGVGRWLEFDESYASLPHLNISNGEWKVSPSDFLFIPEVFASLMKETFDKKIPCRRYVILQNFGYVTEFIPYGDQWANYGIMDAIVSTEQQSNLVKEVFPYVRTTVINPYFNQLISEPLVAKKLIVNIASPKSHVIEHIIKTFYWKYPTMQFVTFRSLRNLKFDTYAKMLREGAITVWHDPETSFGYSALDAIKCGNIVIGKLPDMIPEWMMKDGDIRDCGLWYNDVNEVPDLIAKLVGSWMRDEIPEKITDEMSEVASKYCYEQFTKNVKNAFENMFSERVKELEAFKNVIEKDINAKTTDEQ